MALVEIVESVQSVQPGSRRVFAVNGATVYVRKPDGTQEPVYASSAGGTPVTQPLTTQNGRIEGWVEEDIHVDLVVGNTASTDPQINGYTQRIATTGPMGPVGPEGPDISEIKTRLPINVVEHGAIGDGVANDSVAVQAALDAAAVGGGGSVQGRPDDIYNVEGVSVPTGVTFDLNGATLRHRAASATYGVRVTGNDAALINGVVDGNSPNITADVVPVSVSGSRTKVQDLRIYDAEYHAIQVTGQATQVSILGNWVYKVNAVTASRHMGIALHSTGALDPCTHVLVAGNHVRDTTMSGMGANGVAKYVTFSNNVTVDTGEDGIAAYDRANEHILCVGNNIYSPANNGIHIGGMNAAVVGNTMRDITYRGVAVHSDPNTAPTATDGATVTGNLVDTTVSASSSEAIRVERYTGVTIAGNTVMDSKLSCIQAVDCIDVTISGNVGHDSISGHGVSIAGCTKVVVDGNVATDSAGHGVNVAQHTRADATVVQSVDVAVTGNVLQGHAGSGVKSANVSDYVLVTGNILRLNTAGATSLVGANNRVTDNIGGTVQTYAATNVTTDRAYDANATTVDELADVVGTLITDLRAQGLVA